MHARVFSALAAILYMFVTETTPTH